MGERRKVEGVDSNCLVFIGELGAREGFVVHGVRRGCTLFSVTYIGHVGAKHVGHVADVDVVSA